MQPGGWIRGKLQVRGKEGIEPRTCKGIANDEGHLPGCSSDDERGYTHTET